MLIEDFKKRYTSIPFTTYSRNYGNNKTEVDGIFHLHKEIEVLLVLDGEALLYLEDGNMITIKKGDIVFVPPFTPHLYKIPENSNFNHRCVCFDSSVIYDKALAKNLEDKSLTPKTIINNEICFNFINEAFESYIKKNDGFELRIIGNISLFFAKLKEENLISPIITSSSTSFHKTVIDYIDKNFSDNITSQDIAKILHLNNSYFCRLFKKNFGLPFQNYLSFYRIEKSKSLLRKTDLSVLEVALKVGFNSQSYYSKLFKNHYLLTPSEYRNKK